MEVDVIYNGDCLIGMRKLPNNSIDAIVTDPPYGLSFMGKKWDYDVPAVEIWEECLRVLKPGGYLLAFAGTRTQHRMAVRIEDAGFEIRDMIAWVYGSGFPKSLNIGKAVDKMQGNEREVTADNPNHRTLQETGTMVGEPHTGDGKISKGTSEWEGWGTALKPAFEPITVARKPIEGTVADNCLKWGVGGINIDGCRVETEEQLGREQKDGPLPPKYGFNNNSMGNKFQEGSPLGRFPANFIHDGSEEVLELFPNTKSGSGVKKKASGSADSIFNINKIEGDYLQGDSDSAARFFYCAKASKSERNAGCEELEEKYNDDSRKDKDAIGCNNPNNRSGTPSKNFHPTVKPIALMEYLVKLVSREGQIVLDPFAGSGSTCVACVNLDRKYIGFEMDKNYSEIAEKRIENVTSVIRLG